jgi:hypothetical protein
MTLQPSRSNTVRILALMHSITSQKIQHTEASSVIYGITTQKIKHHMELQPRKLYPVRFLILHGIISQKINTMRFLPVIHGITSEKIQHSEVSSVMASQPKRFSAKASSKNT